MPRLSSLSGGELAQIRGHGFFAPSYLLLAPNTVVFRAQINQVTFDTSFAEIAYDTVSIGSFSDVLEGFTCYISDTTDPRDADVTLRIRKDATASTIFINETSAILTDDQYIIVTKDVREAVKLPRIDANDVYYKDYDITYRKPKPMLYDLQTAYVIQQNAIGNASIGLSPKMLPVAFNSSPSSWLWDLDGGSFSVGGPTSQNITALYTSPGHYMPRVTVTDSNGVSNWFSPHIFVIPLDFEDSNIYPAITELSIDQNLDTGISAQITVDEGLDNVLDYSLAVIYAPSNKTEIVDGVQFVGRWRNESNRREASRIDYQVLGTSFDLDGLASIMGRMISRNIPMRYETSPDEWDELNNLTPWRAVSYYLVEHTTIPNIHSITFDDTGLAYRTTNYTAGDANVLDTVENIIAVINAVVEYAPQGEIHIARQAIYQSATDRNALDTIADWTLQDLAAEGDSGISLEISRDFIPIVGIDEAWGGIYNTTTKKIQAIQARIPAVTQTDGNELTELNRQVLTANSDIPTASEELGQRGANDFAAKQPTDTMEVTHPPEYRFLQTSASQWYTWTIPATANDRGLSYSTAIRWILTSVNISYNIEEGYPTVGATYQRETTRAGYQVITQIPPTENAFTKPIQPGVDDYYNLPEEPGIDSPDGTGFAPGEELPFTDDDISGINDPTDPGTSQENNQQSGDFGVVWDASSIWTFQGMLSLENPVYKDITPIDIEDFTTITDVKLARQSNNNWAWALSNNGTDSRLWRTKNVGFLRWVYTQVPGIYTDIRVTSTRVGLDAWLYILDPEVQADDPWEHTFEFKTASGDARRDITFGNDGTWVVASGNPVGNYVPDLGWEDTTESSGTTRFRGVNILKSITATIDTVKVRYDLTKGNYEAGQIAAVLEITGGVYLDQVVESSVPAGTDQEYEWNLGGLATGGNSVRVAVYSDQQVTPFNYAGDVVMKEIVIEGTGTNPFIQGIGTVNTRFSQNNGVGFHPDSPRFASDSNSGLTGIDVQEAGGLVAVGSKDQMRQALDEGAYGLVTNGVTTGSSAYSIRYHGVNQSRFVFGSAASVSGESMWRNRVSGQEAITPNDGAADGLVVSKNAIDVAPTDETRIYTLMDFGGTVKLAYSTDDGDTWNFQTGVTNSANYIRAKQTQLLYITDGTVVKVSTDGGQTLLTRTSPSSSLVGIEVK